MIQARQRWVVILGIVGFSLVGIWFAIVSVTTLWRALSDDTSVALMLIGLLISAVCLVFAILTGALVRLLCYVFRNYDSLAEADRRIDRRAFWNPRNRRL